MVINQVKVDALAHVTTLTDQVLRCALGLTATVSLFKAAVLTPWLTREGCPDLRTEIVEKIDNLLLAGGELDRHFHAAQKVLGLMEPDDERH